MLEGKAVVGETDMTAKMQAHAMRCASEALDSYDVTDCKDIACYIKKHCTTFEASNLVRSEKAFRFSFGEDFDKLYGPGWQCVVGTSFGSYVTHSCGNFIHFNLGIMAVMLFRGS